MSIVAPQDGSPVPGDKPPIPDSVWLVAAAMSLVAWTAGWAFGSGAAAMLAFLLMLRAADRFHDKKETT